MADRLLATRIAQFQFCGIRPKAASDIKGIRGASLLLGHTKGDIAVARHIRSEVSEVLRHGIMGNPPVALELSRKNILMSQQAPGDELLWPR